MIAARARAQITTMGKVFPVTTTAAGGTPSLPLASIELLGAHMFFSTSSGFISQVLAPLLAGVPEAAHLLGVARLAMVVALLSFMYGPRFHPGSANADAAQATLRW